MVINHLLNGMILQVDIIFTLARGHTATVKNDPSSLMILNPELNLI